MLGGGGGQSNIFFLRMWWEVQKSPKNSEFFTLAAGGGGRGKKNAICLGEFGRCGGGGCFPGCLVAHLYKQVQPFSSSYWPQVSRLITSNYNEGWLKTPLP